MQRPRKPEGLDGMLERKLRAVSSTRRPRKRPIAA
jgi:hypothetical protein